MSARAGHFEVAEEARGAATERGCVGCIGQRGIERVQCAFSARSVGERGESGEPGFDHGVREFLHQVKQVLLRVLGEFEDVLICIEERGDEPAVFERQGWERV